MQHTDYKYKDGLVGLYTINKDLISVILDFPEGQHNEVAKALGLENAELIEEPYNKYLEHQGKLSVVSLDQARGLSQKF